MTKTRPSLRDIATAAKATTGYKSPINRLLDALDDDDAAELRDLFADTALPGRAVAHAINTVYGDHAVLVSWGKVLTEGQVQKWRHDNL